MTERQYQATLTRKLRRAFPGCVLLKNDSGYQQGIPDWTILYGDKWAMLEVKADADSPTRPNQEYFVKQLNEMSFAAFIHPGNERAVIDALKQAFGL